MPKIVDVQEVQAQLDKAARDAKDGSADVRAGRFVHQDAMAATRGRPASFPSGLPRPNEKDPFSTPRR